MHRSLANSLAVVAVMLMAIFATASASEPYRIAVYYFPGWKDNVKGFFAAQPWDLIKAYPDRKPLLGWYAEGNPSIMDQQLQWMSQYGITHVIFDWYWTDDGKPFLDQAINSYLHLADQHKVGFAILWANHRRAPISFAQWRQIVQVWISQYFSQPGYMREGDKPVVLIFSPDGLERSAHAFGMTTEELLAEAQTIAHANNLPGILFAANSAADFGAKGPSGRGYGALSGYVYQRGFSGAVAPYPKDYPEMVAQYQMTWDWMLTHISLPYYVPVALGWDKRPWFPVQAHAEHDTCCSANADEFEQMLRAAKQRVDQHPTLTRRTLVICCWNEFGEGNFLEPTEAQQFNFLQRVKKVFLTK